MPVIVSPALAAAESFAFPLTHARIGYQTFVPDSTITASTEAAGFPASAVALSMTYEKWKPTALPATIEFVLPADSDSDYVGIAAHTLGSAGCTVAVEYAYSLTEGETAFFQSHNELDGGPSLSMDFAAQEYELLEESYTAAETIAPSDDSAIMVLVKETMARYWRLTITGSTIPEIGVVYIGKVLAMQRMIYGGHSPGTLSRQTDIRPTRSEGGQFLGRSIIRQGLATSFQWENLKAQWYRDNFDPFVEAARTAPFFIAWRPEDFPREVIYCWTSSDISPSNQGVKDFMSVGFSAQGHA